MKRTLLLGVLIGSSTLAPGCMLGGLHLEAVATSAQKPSNVAVYVAVAKGKEPAPDLTAQNFHVIEDGLELGPEQTQQVLLPRDVAAAHRALLLIDMSGPVTTGDTRELIAAAAARFVSLAHTTEAVTVYAFDGAPALKLIAEFPQGPEPVPDIPELATFTPSDPSSNLHSAVIEAASQLEARLMTAQKPVRVGSLIVFARGPDLAGRVSEEKMLDALEDSGHLVFAIGTKDALGFRPQRVGHAGAFVAESMTTLAVAFEEAGTRVAKTVGGYYLLSYCSPARAGTRRLRLEAKTTDEKGKEVSGSVSLEFDATGFTSGCDPNQRPRFVAPPPKKEKEEHEEQKAGARPGRRPAAPAAEPGTKPAPDEESEAVVPPPSKPGYAQ